MTCCYPLPLKDDKCLTYFKPYLNKLLKNKFIILFFLFIIFDLHIILY